MILPVLLLVLAAGVGAAALHRSRMRAELAETRLRLQTGELDAARQHGQSAMQARSDFLAVMSHEMRTPLNGIIGVAGLLLDLPAGTPLGPAERHDIATILQSGEHLLQLVNDILDFSRLEAGRLELDETAFDIRVVVTAAIDLLRAEARRKGLSLVLEVDADVPVRAGGDPSRLRQVLLNLVGNAVKFTQAGGVRVEVGRGPSEPGGLRLAFRISDTGIGIAPEALERLFGEFVQADSSISRRFGGSGLGLSISRQLVERMGGHITVESTPGVGSVFRFDLLLRARRASDSGGGTEGASVPAPVAVAAPAPVAASGVVTGAVTGGGSGGASVSSAPGTTPLRILIAEDNATNRLVLTRTLERQGHSVTCVTNGVDVVIAVQQAAYDLVLMDVMMPEQDGIAATAAIRALPTAHRLIPIIGITANALPSEAQAGRAAGMNGFAVKPIQARMLAEVIAQTLAGVAPTTPEAPKALPISGENRGFDPAVLDILLRERGTEVATSLVAAFIARVPPLLARLRALEAEGATTAVAEQARTLATDAATFGLMRAARAGLDLGARDFGPAGDPQSLAAFERLIGLGLEELKHWQHARL